MTENVKFKLNLSAGLAYVGLAWAIIASLLDIVNAVTFIGRSEYFASVYMIYGINILIPINVLDFVKGIKKYFISSENMGINGKAFPKELVWFVLFTSPVFAFVCNGFSFYNWGYFGYVFILPAHIILLTIFVSIAKRLNSEKKEQKRIEKDKADKISKANELLNEVGNAFFVKHYKLLKTKSNILDIFDAIKETQKDLNENLTINRINSGIQIFKNELNVVALNQIVIQQGLEKNIYDEARKILSTEEKNEKNIEDIGGKKSNSNIHKSEKRADRCDSKEKASKVYIPTPDYFDIKCPCCNNELSIDRNFEYTDKFSCPYCNTNINLRDYN